MKRLSTILFIVLLCLVVGTGAFGTQEHGAKAESLTINNPANLVEHEAETFTLNPSSAGMVLNNAGASGGRELYVWSNATATKSVALERVEKITVRARGMLCGSEPPRVEVRVDGIVVGSVRVSSTSYASYTISANVAPGPHQLALAYTNDLLTSTCDRNVLLDKVTLEGTTSGGTTPPPPPANLVEHEAETFTLNPSSAGMVLNNAGASGGRELYVWSNATATKSVALERVEKITVRARGMLCGSEPPRVEVRAGGSAVGAVGVSSTAFADYTVGVNIPAGTHQLGLAYVNDVRTSSCDRNVFLDKVTLEGEASQGGGGASPPPPPSPPPSSDNPLAGEEMYVKPVAQNHARQTADSWYQQGRTADAQQMEKIARAPSAYWFGDDPPLQVQSYVNNLTTTITSHGKLPLYVAYNIPIRDCGSYSSGGASSAAAYRSWIDAFAAGIGARKAIVVLEPDAIPDWGCLSGTQREERRQLLSYAIDSLKAKPNIYVYVDAGHWQSPAEIASRLTSVGVERADGFSINVSNFQWTSDMVAYGNDVSSRIGGKHFLIDTSRNGVGPYTGGYHSGGCAPQFNPPDRALGPQPTTATGNNLVDAFVWVKVAGYSDGACGSFPSSGAWMPDVALDYARRAAY